MKVLIACEFSGIVRDAFARRGHEAWSCDLLPSESVDHIYNQSHGGGSAKHIRRDILELSFDGWDIMIAHPPCKFLALCQAWRRKPSKMDCIQFGLSKDDTMWRLEQREKAVEFARKLWNAPIAKICLENPMSILSTRLCKKSQTINPWEYGHGEKKETWLWLKNLPLLRPTNIVEGREEKVFYMSPSEKRSIDRSRTYPGIANAMAEQWGSL